AEDGIRDATVTGVQTCALPILLTKRQKSSLEGISYRMGKPNFGPLAEGTISTSRMTSSRRDNFAIADELLAEQWGLTTKEISARSEERRVGNEGRDRSSRQTGQ